MSGTAPSPVFNAAFTITVGAEGGYVNNPADPGGETKFGISRAAYPTLDIADLTVADAEAIYARDYWSKISGDQLPPAIAVLAFDAAVNNGVARAAVWLQQAAGVTADGVIGPQTLAAIAKADLPTLVSLFHGARIDFMAQLSTWPTFGVGWSRRLALMPFLAAQASASLGSLPPLAQTTTA